MKENKITVSQEIKKHLLTGISWTDTPYCGRRDMYCVGASSWRYEMSVKKQEQSRGCLIRLAAGEWG